MYALRLLVALACLAAIVPIYIEAAQALHRAASLLPAASAGPAAPLFPPQLSGRKP